MKNIHLFLDVFVLIVLCLIIFTGPARICDVTMSQTWISGCHGNVTEDFHLFTYNFARFTHFGCFGHFGGFISAVSLVSLVSVVSFRSFRWFRFGRFVSLFQVLVHAKEKHLTFIYNCV